MTFTNGLRSWRRCLIRRVKSGPGPVYLLSCYDLAPSGLHLSAVVERGIKGTSALRRQVQQIPNWTQLIDAALLDVLSQPRMTTVKMAQRAVGVTGEN